MSQEASKICCLFQQYPQGNHPRIETIESCQKFLQQGPPDKVSLQGFFNHTVLSVPS